MAKKRDEFLRDWEQTLSQMGCGIYPQTEKFLPTDERKLEQAGWRKKADPNRLGALSTSWAKHPELVA